MGTGVVYAVFPAEQAVRETVRARAVSVARVFAFFMGSAPFLLPCVSRRKTTAACPTPGRRHENSARQRPCTVPTDCSQRKTSLFSFNQAGFLAHGSLRTAPSHRALRGNGLCGSLPVHSDRIARDSHPIPFYPSRSWALAEYVIVTVPYSRGCAPDCQAPSGAQCLSSSCCRMLRPQGKKKAHRK